MKLLEETKCCMCEEPMSEHDREVVIHSILDSDTRIETILKWIERYECWVCFNLGTGDSR